MTVAMLSNNVFRTTRLPGATEPWGTWAPQGVGKWNQIYSVASNMMRKCVDVAGNEQYGWAFSGEFPP